MKPYVGLLVVDLLIPGALTLKDKRQVVRSVLDRTAARYNVSAAEIDHLDNHTLATIAFACVANEPKRVHEVLSMVREVAESETRLEVTDARIEMY